MDVAGGRVNATDRGEGGHTGPPYGLVGIVMTTLLAAKANCFIEDSVSTIAQCHTLENGVKIRFIIIKY